MSRGAINDIRKDPRFLQMMLKKLQSHKENLDLSNMGHRVTSDEMIREEWLPIMPENAKEDWLKVALDPTPLWPQFEAFLEKQADACRQRERLGLATATPVRECSKCGGKNHSSEDCKAA